MRTSSVLVRALGPVVLAAVLLGCGGTAPPAPEAEEPAHVEALAGDDSLHRITLTERAAERIGIEVAEALATPTSVGRVSVPYSSIIYDAEGVAWAYVAETPLVFVREQVTVSDVVPDSTGGRAVLSVGPAPGTSVVSVGVAELFGTEFSVGH